MSSPTYEFSSLRKILARSKVRLGIENTNTYDFFLKDCIIEAAKKMDTREDLIEKTAELEITDDFTACLPSDFVKFDRGQGILSPLVFAEGENEVVYPNNAFLTPIFTNAPFINCAPSQYPIGYQPTINIQNGIIYFSNNVTTRACRISYLAVNLEENGDVKIPENNARAILNYAMWQWSLANDEPKTKWIEYKTTWVNSKLARRGQSRLLDTFERDRMYRIMNEVI